MKTKQCLDCNEKIMGRTDKKFCNDACRNNYHNKLNSETSAIMRRVNNSLRRNRRILQELINSNNGKSDTLAKILTTHGFNFEYYTHVANTSSGKTYFFCYEYGYRKLENDCYNLIRSEE